MRSTNTVQAAVAIAFALSAAVVIPGSDLFGAISLVPEASNKLFQSALQITAAHRRPQVLSIPVAAGENRVAAVVHVFPVRGEAFYTLGGARHFVVVTQAGSRSGIPDQALLRALFDLTPAEARLTEALIGNSTISKYVTDTGASQNTVKTHLKRFFEKTGVSRQADLVRLLSGLTISPPTSLAHPNL